MCEDQAGEGGEGGQLGALFLWVTGANSQTLPDGGDGRYRAEGAGCANCSNAPFEYTFVVDGVRLPQVGMRYRILAIRYRILAMRYRILAMRYRILAMHYRSVRLW